jgi:hypothetical protein
VASLPSLKGGDYWEKNKNQQMSVHFTCKPSPSVSPRQARLAPNRAPDTLNNALLTLKVLVLSSGMDLAESGFVYLYFLRAL